MIFNDSLPNPCQVPQNCRLVHLGQRLITYWRLSLCVYHFTLFLGIIAKDCFFTLVKSRLLLGSPSWSVGCFHAENDLIHRKMVVNCPIMQCKGKHNILQRWHRGGDWRERVNSRPGGHNAKWCMLWWTDRKSLQESAPKGWMALQNLLQQTKLVPQTHVELTPTFGSVSYTHLTLPTIYSV